MKLVVGQVDRYSCEVTQRAGAAESSQVDHADNGDDEGELSVYEYELELVVICIC